MGFLLGDWQFWTVTACAAGAVWMLIKPFAGRGTTPAGPCASCPKNARVNEGGQDGGRGGLVRIGTIVSRPR